MWLAQALQHMLKEELITLKAPLRNPNTSAPTYHPNERCAYQSDSPGHDTNNCRALKNKIQDMIDAKEVEFDPPGAPNVITAPMPNHWECSSSFWIFNCNLFYCSNIYLLMSNFVSLMHYICLSWIDPFVFTIFTLCFLLPLYSTLVVSL